MSALVALAEPKRPPSPQPAPAPAEKTRSPTDAFLIFARRQVALGLAEWVEGPDGQAAFCWIDEPEPDSAKKGKRRD